MYGDVCECGSKSFEIRDTYSKRTGMVCPTCGRILIPYAKPGKEVEEQKVLDCNSFSAPNAKNAKCVFVVKIYGSQMWPILEKTGIRNGYGQPFGQIRPIRGKRPYGYIKITWKKPV